MSEKEKCTMFELVVWRGPLSKFSLGCWFGEFVFMVWRDCWFGGGLFHLVRVGSYG